MEPMMIYPNELLIGDTNFHRHIAPHVDDMGQRKKGLVPRDYDKYPLGTYSGEVGMHAVEDLKVIDRADWPALIQQQIDTSTRLSDYVKRGNKGVKIPSRDQNGKGYCWFHSGVSAMLATRARDDLPYVDLSAYAGACQIKNFRDEGGWGAQGLDWLMTNGVPTSEFWPQQSMSRGNVTEAMKANSKLHRFTEGWIDLAAPQYDRTLSFDQVGTILLSRITVITDFNWWGHSVCGLDLVNGVSQWKQTRNEDTGKLMTLKLFESFWGVNTVTGGYGIRIWNSWGDSWSDGGMGVLTGSKAVPDGATAPRVASASVA